MKQVRTARGKLIDMGALAKANEEVRAVGNVPMNARGDRLDASGNVIATVQRVARKQSDLATAPKKQSISQPLDDAPKKTAKKKAAPKVVAQNEKTREDGTKFVEIEYEDGSMEVREVE